MKRFALNLLTALSVLLLAATAAAWVRSQFVSDFVNYHPRVGERAWTTVKLDTYTGYFSVEVTRYRFVPSNRHHFIYWAVYGRDEPLWDWTSTPYRGRHPDRPYDEDWLTRSTWNFGPPRTRGSTDSGLFLWESRSWRVVEVPYWCAALLFSLLPAARLAGARRKRRRARRGLCRRCGYDLRATPGRCPECGEDAAAESHRGAGDGHRPGGRSDAVAAE